MALVEERHARQAEQKGGEAERSGPAQRTASEPRGRPGVVVAARDPSGAVTDKLRDFLDGLTYVGPLPAELHGAEPEADVEPIAGDENGQFLRRLDVGLTDQDRTEFGRHRSPMSEEVKALGLGRAAVGRRITPDVVLAVWVGSIGLGRLEPAVLGAGVVGNEVGHDPQSEFVRRADQPVDVGQRAEEGIDVV